MVQIEALTISERESIEVASCQYVAVGGSKWFK